MWIRRVSNYLLLLCFLCSAQALSFVPPGSIPLKAGSKPALDLFQDGKKLSPEKARELQDSGIDLSELDPDPTSTYIWRRPSKDRPIPFQAKHADIAQTGEDIYFNSYVSSPSLFFEEDIKLLFSAKKTKDSAKSQVFIAGKYAHNYLFRAALLKRLGYWVPPTKWIQNITLHFSKMTDKTKFLAKLIKNARAEATNWVVDEGDRYLKLQDILVYDLQNQKYNLLENFATSVPIKRRRLLNALSIPYDLCYLPENATNYPWTLGRVVHEHLVLNSEAATHFEGNHEDAKWMARLILSVVNERRIAEDIVAEASFPIEVYKVVLERFIGQRNDLIKKFGLTKFKKIDLTPVKEINHGPRLVQGKLIADTWDPKLEPWPGYATRWVYGDPKNPLSLAEIWALIKSKFLSNLIANGMIQLNELISFNTDINKEAGKENQKAFDKELERFFETGENRTVPIDYWSFPYVDFKLVSGRDIVIGNYLGANNYVQQADTVGWEVKAGMYMGASFLPEVWTGAWKNEGFISHILTHVRPVSSIKESLKTPLKKILVPLSIRKLSKLIGDFNEANFDELKEEDKEDFVKDLNENLKVGESFIISLRYGLNSILQTGFSYSDDVSLFSQIYGRGFLLNRLHIQRVSDKQVVIYSDKANQGKLGGGTNLDFKMPILGASLDLSRGSADSRIYQLELIKADGELNTLTLVTLSEVFKKASIPLWGVPENKHIYIHYDYKQRVGRANLLPFVAGTNAASTSFKITAPNFTEIYDFKRRRNQYLFGKNYEKLTLDLVNAAIRNNTEEKVFVQSTSNGRPADSIKGSSYIKDMFTDVYIDDSETQNLRYSSIQHKWRGWSASNLKSRGLIDKINAKVGDQILTDKELTGVNQILYYTFALNYQVYHEAKDYLLSLGSREARSIFVRHAGNPIVMPASPLSNDPFDSNWYLSDVFSIVYKDIQRSKNSVDSQLRAWHLMMKLVENRMGFKGIEELFGRGNLVATAYYGGLVQLGRDNGDKNHRMTYGDSLGLYGAERVQGPLEAIRNLLGIGQSQFYLDWVMESF